MCLMQICRQILELISKQRIPMCAENYWWRGHSRASQSSQAEITLVPFIKKIGMRKKLLYLNIYVFISQLKNIFSWNTALTLTKMNCKGSRGGGDETWEPSSLIRLPHSVHRSTELQVSNHLTLQHRWLVIFSSPRWPKRKCPGNSTQLRESKSTVFQLPAKVNQHE